MPVTENSHPVLHACFDRLSHIDKLQTIRAGISKEHNLQTVYQQLIPYVETELVTSAYDDAWLDLYQQLFREMETTCLQGGARHDLVIVVPVADRPQHLRDCLHSLLQLCHAFAYGGKQDGCYQKVQVMIADDSQQQAKQLRHREIADEFGKQGLLCIYFGPAEQLSLLQQLSEEHRHNLKSIIGEFDSRAFYHKGASITRNLSYLKLKQLYGDDRNKLYFFVDSDQEFKVCVATGSDEKNIYGLNYFYYLDQIFSDSNSCLLTGKVVGDPPVSPAVMMGRFLDDVIQFLSELSNLEAGHDCQFHQAIDVRGDDASYHDMADLFGFKAETDGYSYKCSIKVEHDHRQCLATFTGKLNHFFDGEHPTRKSFYQYEYVPDSVKPARTVYTGNYVFNYRGFDYFIPFASLKYRMAGPVLGRIIKSELKADFVSAALPMLHKRTVDELGQSEFRAGVQRQASCIDLHEEFERQYFGDVMLFSMEKLTDLGFPEVLPAGDEMEKVIQQVEQDMQQRYVDKHEQIQHKLTQLKNLFDNTEYWWHQSGMELAVSDVRQFIANVEYNFSDNAVAYQRISSKQHRDQCCRVILNAIIHYPQDRLAWQEVLSRI